MKNSTDQHNSNNQTETDQQTSPIKKDSNNIFSVLQSVLAAMFGVQSEAKRQQDFQHGDPSQFIVIGIIMLVVFIFSIIAVVNAILP